MQGAASMQVGAQLEQVLPPQQHQCKEAIAPRPELPPGAEG